MKNKVLTFIIGLLVGAILATTGFLIYEKTNKNNNDSVTQMQMMNPNGDSTTPPEMPTDGENQNANNMDSNTTPPTKPDGDMQNTDSTNATTPPEKPDGDMQNSNSTGTTAPTEKQSNDNNTSL